MLVFARRSHQANEHSLIYTQRSYVVQTSLQKICAIREFIVKLIRNSSFVFRKAGWPSNNLIGAAPAAASAPSILSFFHLAQMLLEQLRRILYCT